MNAIYNEITGSGYLTKISRCWNLDRIGKVNKRLIADK